ncbi:putative copper resistance protein D [Isoptericola sp. CG 20/1183]|uniref:Copper resistance protein D n=1 Tax=Isoptericola halotolerans TaxID=300560 RepID=A0ABX5EHZ1_9MICO|nr:MULTISPECIES: cytochrome c oxidase assembly protein [Isoptericola]PRZ09302.1 putative copper resistance protein D [Isoptericola sp. CG 20/1183]PRZ10103.1 putative copper resistance protein D [Isoptericola halotolerans]
MTSTAPAGQRPRGTAPAPARPWWIIAAGPGAVVAAILALLLAGSWSGAFEALGTFSDPGAVARWGSPLATVLAELGVAVTLGSLFAAACLVPPGRAQARLLDVAGWAAAVWAVAAVVELVLQYAVVSALSPTAGNFGQGLTQFVTDVELGRISLGIIALAAVTSGVALAVRGPVGALCTALLPVAALTLQSTTGHAAGAADHFLAIGAMWLHLMGAALWLGGLAALAVLVVGRFDDVTTAAVARYSPVAAWCLVAVGVSGVANAWIRMEGFDDLATSYGVLLVVKIVLTAALGVLGWAHRTWIVGRLARGASAVRRLFWQLLAVELLVIGAVSGVAVALGSTAPPVPDEVPTDASPAYQLTGYALPPEPTATRWLTEWAVEPILAFACVAGIVVYLRWVVRLRRRGDRWPLGRTLTWCAGMLVLIWTTNGAPTVYGHVIFSGHMVQHMTLAMLVPLLLVLAAPVTLLLRAVPARKDGSRGPREWVLALVHSRVGTFLAQPVVAAVLFAGGMIAFYFTPLFELALTNHLGHLWMIVHFTIVGYLFANALVGIDPGPQRPGYPMRLVLLFATMVFHAFFGVVLTTGTSLLVADWYGNMGRDWGLSAIADQQRGGGIAWGIGELPTLALAIIVAVQWTRSDEREARRRDRQAERDGDAELTAYNDMLARMADQDETAGR